MTTVPHTPGPWILDDFEISGEISGASVCRVLESSDFSCIEEGTEADVQAECEANARVIAAAPDMLSALKMAVDGFAGEVRERDPIPAWLGPAIDAIAKAEGKS